MFFVLVVTLRLKDNNVAIRYPLKCVETYPTRFYGVCTTVVCNGDLYEYNFSSLNYNFSKRPPFAFL